MLYVDLVIDPVEGWELLNYKVRTHLSWQVALWMPRLILFRGAAKELGKFHRFPCMHIRFVKIVEIYLIDFF